MTNLINTRPHPGPLPQERERDFVQSEAANSLRVRYRSNCASIRLSKTAPANVQRVELFLPLLGERAGVRADNHLNHCSP
jgi:hypothetical protein